MAKDELADAKRSYRSATEIGDRTEQARWSNVIGDIHKNRGEYVEALKWLRIDYDVSTKYLPEKQLLPTCQSIGELHFRLLHFQDALVYQKKHLELAKDKEDLAEQQRASTQLARTYHEMFLRSDDDIYSIQNAKKYFNSAMNLAKSLKENSPNKSNFLKEYIDAYNNIGMLQRDLENFDEALKMLTRGLQICDDEEVARLDDARSRLHHNLGSVYMGLRKWSEAQKHILEDIHICNSIQHRQGEAKGYINLGELHNKVQKYDEAISCYKKALDLARSMEDEDDLVNHINENMRIVKQAIKEMDELKKEEKNLKKLARNMEMAIGTSSERKCLLQQDASLSRLIDISNSILAWREHKAFAKRKKQIATKLCDQEKLGDSFLHIGESYQKLRIFDKALKWVTKSWKVFKAIGNLEGQALAKNSIGVALDSSGDWAGALDAFEEAYANACEAKLPSIQLSALENMHYSNMIRFENFDEARRLRSIIDKKRDSATEVLEPKILKKDCCSETETEGDDQLSNSRSDISCSPEISKSSFNRYKPGPGAKDIVDDAPSNSFLCPENASKSKPRPIKKPSTSREPDDSSLRSQSRLASSQAVSRKRVRVILSDDESENDEVPPSSGRFRFSPAEDVATSDEVDRTYNMRTAHGLQDVSPVASHCVISANTPINHEGTASSYKSSGYMRADQDAKDVRSSCSNEVVSVSNVHSTSARCRFNDSENLFQNHRNSGLSHHICDDSCCKHVTFKVEEELVTMELSSCMIGDKVSIAALKVDISCLYFLQLPKQKRSKGLLPIIQHLKCRSKVLDSLESTETFKDYFSGKGWIDVSVDAWVPKRLMKLYIDCCMELSEPPNLHLLKKLYNLEVSEDEIIVSDCGLQDMSVAPLLSALHLHKTVAVLDLSHNMLGNETMEKLQQLFTSSRQKYGGLILDLHQNRFGPTALFQICECPVLFSRLEVLNISGNRLTDSCASYLANILKNCKALYGLDIGSCSITSRTVQKIADSLDSGSSLVQLGLGYNNSISGNAIVNLLAKLATLDRFAELNLNGLKLNKAVVNGICQLAKTSCLSELMLQDTCIGTDGALHLLESLSSETRELVKLDLSSCGLTSEYIFRLNDEISLIGGVIELKLGWNPITQECGNALAALLKNPYCCLRVLVLNKCQLGVVCLLRTLEALAENLVLEELNLAANTCSGEVNSLSLNFNGTLNSMHADLSFANSSVKASACNDAHGASVDPDIDQLEVADSEDDLDSTKPSVSGIHGSSMSFSEKYSSNLESQFIQELSSAISRAKHLQMLDLSDNGFSEQHAETLYHAWSANSRAPVAARHIEGNVVHLKVQGNYCCGLKPCCRKIN
ncbi:protein TONSOKU isoform X1 [Daucus carota subsp. sativus]|nr:PREDICTED: protein TONSOKU isoform X1 [Daucus carota subsp. sativus]